MGDRTEELLLFIFYFIQIEQDAATLPGRLALGPYVIYFDKTQSN